MVPLPTSDMLLLREHLFYETGNLKYVMPFVSGQNYHLGDDGSYEFNFVDFIARIVMLSVILIACISIKRVYSMIRKSFHKHDTQKYKPHEIV